MWCLHGWDAAKIARRQKMADIPLGFAIAHNVVEVERYVCNIARNSFVSGIDLRHKLELYLSIVRNIAPNVGPCLRA